MSARGRWALGHALSYATSMLLVAGIASLAGHQLFAIDSWRSAGVGWSCLVATMLVICWVMYPWEMRYRRKQAERRSAREAARG